MTVQTAYSTEHGVAYAGMPADLQLLNTVSRLNSTGDVIPYGYGVVTDDTVTGDQDAMRLPTENDVYSQFNGIVMYEINRAQADGAVAGAVDNNFGTVITEGVVWTLAVVAVTKDDPVYLRIFTSDIGRFTNVADGGNTILITGAKWVSTTGAVNTLAKISLGLGG